MAKKKVKEELPILPGGYGLDESLFNELSGAELLSLIKWIAKRKKQVIQSDLKKCEKQVKTLSKKKMDLELKAKEFAHSRQKVEGEIKPFEKDYKKVSSIQEAIDKDSEKIKTLSEQKKSNKEKLDEMKAKAPSLFEIIERYNDAKKKEDDNQAKLKKNENEIKANNDNLKTLKKTADALKKEKEEKQFKAAIKHNVKVFAEDMKEASCEL